jgi:hypothetical protein
MLYEKLDPAMQQTVDEFAARLADLSWPRRSDALAAVALPFAEQFEGPQATLAGKGFLTAVLERLGDDDAVTEPTQAVLLSLSLNPHHRQMADEWLALHPEVRAVVDAELAGDERAPDA